MYWELFDMKYASSIYHMSLTCQEKNMKRANMVIKVGQELYETIQNEENHKAPLSTIYEYSRLCNLSF